MGSSTLCETVPVTNAPSPSPTTVRTIYCQMVENGQNTNRKLKINQAGPVRSKVKVKSVCIYQFKLVKVKISDNVFTRSSGCGMSVRMKRTNCCPTSFVVWELSQQLTERSYKVLVLAGNRRPLFGLSG